MEGLKIVTFDLVVNNDTISQYLYYPENHRKSRPGILVYYKKTDHIEIKQVAEEDICVTHTMAELNSLRDAVNEMRMEEGRAPLSEKEWACSTEDETYYLYASHASSKIQEEFQKGHVLEQGMSAWY